MAQCVGASSGVAGFFGFSHQSGSHVDEAARPIFQRVWGTVSWGWNAAVSSISAASTKISLVVFAALHWINPNLSSAYAWTCNFVNSMLYDRQVGALQEQLVKARMKLRDYEIMQEGTDSLTAANRLLTVENKELKQAHEKEKGELIALLWLTAGCNQRLQKKLGFAEQLASSSQARAETLEEIRSLLTDPGANPDPLVEKVIQLMGPIKQLNQVAGGQFPPLSTEQMAIRAVGEAAEEMEVLLGGTLMQMKSSRLLNDAVARLMHKGALA
jgi:hypothetical protein